MKLEFSRQIIGKSSGRFHADRQMDGQTDMTKLLVAFCNFGNAPKSDLKITVFSVATQCSLVILQHYLGKPCCLKPTVEETFFFLPII